MQTSNFVLIDQAELELLLQAANQYHSRANNHLTFANPQKTQGNNSSYPLQRDACKPCQPSIPSSSYFNSSLFFSHTPVQQNIWTDSYPTYPAPKPYFGH